MRQRRIAQHVTLHQGPLPKHRRHRLRSSSHHECCGGCIPATKLHENCTKLSVIYQAIIRARSFCHPGHLWSTGCWSHEVETRLRPRFDKNIRPCKNRMRLLYLAILRFREPSCSRAKRCGVDSGNSVVLRSLNFPACGINFTACSPPQSTENAQTHINATTLSTSPGVYACRASHSSPPWSEGGRV